MPRDSSNSSVERTSDPRRRRSQPSAAPPPAPPPARTEPELDPPPKASTSRIPSSTAESSSTRHHPYHSNSRREDEKGQRKPAPYLTIHPENPDLLWCKTCHDYRHRFEFNPIQSSLVDSFGRSRKGEHPRCKRCVVTPVERRKCSNCNEVKANTLFSEAQRKKNDSSICKSCVSGLENKNDRLKRADLQADPWHTTELDGLDSDPDDEVLEALENPSGPVNLKGYDNEDSSDDD